MLPPLLLMVVVLVPTSTGAVVVPMFWKYTVLPLMLAMKASTSPSPSRSAKVGAAQ